MNLTAHHLPFLTSAPPKALRALGLAILFAVVCTALDATPAQAVTRTDYAVMIEGTVAYSRADSWPSPYGAYTWDEQAAFKWRTQFNSTFIGNSVAMTSSPSTEVTQVDAELANTIPTVDGPRTGACTGSSHREPTGSGRLAPSLITDPTAAKEILDIRVLDSVLLDLPNCTGLLAGNRGGIAVTNGDALFPNGPFDTPFDMPHEAIGMGKIIQLLDDTVTGSRCPGYRDGTVSCSLAWSAKVTFVRTGQQEIGPVPDPAPGDEDLVVPLPGDDEDLVIPLPGPDEDLIIPLPPRGKLSPRAERAQLSLRCATACSGQATAFAAQDRGHASASRALARTRFTGAPGRTTTVTLRFRPQARRAIRRAGGVRVVLGVTPRTGGRPTRRTVLLQLPRPHRARSSRTAPPIKGGVHCHQTVKRSYSLSAVAKRGMPVKVTCDGRARVQVIFSLDPMTPQAGELLKMFSKGNSNPGICRSHDVVLPAAGSITLRPELLPHGARIARRYRRTKLIVHFLTWREDGSPWSESALNRRTVLVR